MARFAALMVLLGSAGAAVLRDVPVGECHMCEVTCFEDCMLKYDREILQTDLLQLAGRDQAKKNRTQVASDDYSKCLADDKCPCEKEDKKKASLLQLPAGSKQQKENTTSCAIGEASCAQNCSRKVVNKIEIEANNSKNKKVAVPKVPKKKQALLQRDYAIHYPIHSVQVGVFSKGAMNMDQCLKFCLAATCGCDKAPGLDTIDKLFNAIKQNDAAAPGEKDFSHRKGKDIQGAVMDTHGSAHFKPAKIQDCAKGMIGKKVSKGLFVSFGGVGNEIEVCTKPFMEKLMGPGDHSKKMKLCQSTKSEDMKWGCIWNEKKGYCMVGFSENLHCLKKYYTDPTKL